MSTPELRKAWRLYHIQLEQNFQEWDAWEERQCDYDTDEPPPAELPFPEEFRDMICGAKTRAGTPCKRKDLYPNGRCHLHGGPSSGPKTPEGKAKSSLNGMKPKRKKRTP